MKAAALTTVVMLTLSASAFAQDSRKEARNDREYRDGYSELTIEVRNSLPAGEAFQGVRWSDIIGGGLGLDLQYSHLWRASSWVYGGYYAQLGIDSYSGRSSTQTDPVLGTIDIRTDRLNVANLVFGGRLRQNLSGFHFDENIGVGAAMYMKQEFDVKNTGLDKLELIKSSANYLATIGVRVGAPIGKDVDLNLGVAYQWMGAPSEGENFGGKFKSLPSVVLGLSLDIGF